MSRLIESIKLLDGTFYNLPWHRRRMEHSLSSLYGVDAPVGLETFLSAREHPRKGLYKCRVLYDDQSMEMSLTPYEPRNIRRVKVIEDDQISYAFKFADRSAIERLYRQRGDCDDVVIVRRGLITDCSFSNIAFRKGYQWFTPEVPLLKGTMREKLIEQKILIPREIRVTEIRSFDTFRLMNAMLEFERPEIEVSEIVF